MSDIEGHVGTVVDPFTRIVELEKALGDQARHNKSLVNRIRTLEKKLAQARGERDEVLATLSAIREGCYSMSREDLVQKITAINTHEWSGGGWLKGRILRSTTPLHDEIRELKERIARLEGGSSQ